MGLDVRVDENEVVPPPVFSLRNMEVNDGTSEWEIFRVLLPNVGGG